MRRTVVLLTALASLAVATPASGDTTAVPEPVLVPATGSAADPGVIQTGGHFRVFTTGAAAPGYRSTSSAAAPYTALGGRLTNPGDLTDYWFADMSVWAPDVLKAGPSSYVLYFSGRSKRLGGDNRCIGIATSSSPDGPFTPLTRPIVCPGSQLAGVDGVPDRIDANATGVIDAAPFTDADGNRFLTYKTQGTPSSLRMVRISDDGLSATGTSRQLVRDDGIIENPVMLQRGRQFVLLASRYGFNNCSYATVWMRSTDRWDFGGRSWQSLMTTGGTGICGPGGADPVKALDGTHWRLFLHGWICGSGTQPCDRELPDLRGLGRRVVYVAVLGWGADNATPTLGKFLTPEP
jgi:arabinan endo-1,5-alpha-L-arabinosidase